MSSSVTSGEPMQLAYGPPPGGFGPPGGGGGYGPPGGGYGPPGPPGGYGPPGGGYGPPPGGGFGPPGGGYGPPGYRPPPPKSGSGGKIAIGCLGLFVLAGVGVGVLQYKARQRLSAFSKELDDSTAKIDKAWNKLVAEQAQAGSNDKCVAAVNDRLAKVHAATDNPPASIPDGATLVCDSTSWQTSCSTPSVFVGNTAFAAGIACTDPASAERKALDDLAAKKPYPSSSEVDGWSKDVDTAVAAHKAALAAAKPLGVIAAMGSACETTAVESYVDNSTGTHRTLEANACQMTMTWVDASGNVLGRLKATGHGSPPESARKSQTLSDSELTDANDESQRAGLEDGWTQLQKKIDAVNKKGGAATPAKPSTPAPAVKTTPKAPVPTPKAPVPPAKKK